MTYPKIQLRDETMREGMQIESANILIDAKVELINELAGTGLRRLVIGYFASPRYTPQMRDIDEIISKISPIPGVEYLAGAPNAKGRERLAKHSPPLTIERGRFENPHLHVRLSDTFERRNTNVTQAEQIARWPRVIEKAIAEGATGAGIFLESPWGSNFEGPVGEDERVEWFECMHALWDKVGVPVTTIGWVDSESWGMPHTVEGGVQWALDRWPDLTDFHFHIHNARGTALAQIYTIIRLLDERHSCYFESACGGIGGCPYCGNGRATGMAPTEDLIVMLEEMGIDTGVDVEKLVRFCWHLEEVLGRPLMGHVSKCGWLARNAEELYDPNLPFIETYEQSRHFLLGTEVTAGGIYPWREAIPRPSRPYGTRVHPPTIASIIEQISA